MRKHSFELTPEKRRLLEALLQKEGTRPSRVERIPRREESGPIELSFAQERMWFLEQLLPGNAVYIIPAAVRLHGALEVAALAASFTEFVRRHEVLRTTLET